MIHVTRFDIFSKLSGAYASRVHTKYFFTAHAMTNVEKEALLSAYNKQYSEGEWRVNHIDIDCAVIKEGENE